MFLSTRLMEPPRVSLSPHRYLHPGSTSPASSSALSLSSSQPVQASSKTTQSPKGSRTQTITPAKTIPSGQTRAGPTSPLANSHVSVSCAEEASQAQRLSAPPSHPSTQQTLQVEPQAGEAQSVKTLLAKKLCHGGNAEMEQTVATANAGINNGLAPGPECAVNQLFVRPPSQSQFRVSNSPTENHQKSSHVIPCSTSQAIHVQQHLSVTPPSSLAAPMGQFVVAQPSLNAIAPVGNSALPNSLMNSVPNQGVEIQQNVNQSSLILSQNHTPQLAHNTTSQLVSNTVQLNGQVPQVGTFLSAQSQQQPVHVQIRPSSTTTTVPGNTFIPHNSSQLLQNQPQNGPSQLNPSFPATVVKKMAVGQYQQSSINLMPNSLPVSTCSVPRPGLSSMSVSVQPPPCSSVPIQSTSLTQTISSPAVAALLTSNNQHGSPQMIISNSVQQVGAGQGQIMTRPAQQQQQQQQQVPTTVVIQTPPGTIVMPSRQLQGGTVSFIVPPQYRQGSPVTLIQQQPSAGAGGSAGVNMLPSLALANSGGAGQALPAQQRQIVLAPGQTIPMGMPLPSLQGSTVIRNHPACINSIQQPPQQHNYIIQASSSQILSTPVSSLQSSSYQVVPQQTPQLPIAGGLVSNIISESQQARSEAGVPAHQSSMPSVVMQQVQCNGSGHDQNGVQRSPDPLTVNDSPPSPVPISEKEMLNGKGSTPDIDSDHIKSGLKLGSKLNGLVHSTVTEHSKEVSPSPTQANSNSHGTVLVNGCVTSTGLPSQHANIPIQGLQIRPAPSGMMNGVSQSSTVGPLHQLGNSLQNQQSLVIQQQQHHQQQQPQQQFLQQPHQLPSLQAQVPLQLQPQPRQQLQVQQAQLSLQTQQQQHPQLNLHQGQNQLVHIHQAQQQQQQTSQQPPVPQFQRVVSVRPVQPALHQAQNAMMRPRISTLPCPSDQQPLQQQQQPLQAGPRPAGLPRSGSAPIGEAGGHTASLTNTSRSANRMPTTPVATVTKKAPPLAKPSPVSETVSRLRKKKVGPNEVVVSPGSVQTRKQAQGHKPVHIAMQYMCEWGSCRKCFSTARLVLIHVVKQHVPLQDSSCQWVGCEKLVRKRWSLISHIQDHHCSEMAMRAACQRRYQALQQKASGVVPTPPPPPPTPMIYPPDAAIQAIRRFSVKQPYAEFAEQREGPVSKHIRLTSALILRNICHASSYGRRLVRQHEEVLSYNTMNAVESSTALSHCLWEISQCCEQDPHDSAS
ncbi:AT-rich interactive domain-containing protein 2 [Elysia marginata]|uniref:AT-rich interactive domain-containing protein 2 n=1 Tax=Elysia marginata TaxID=1093978 RepID=A0AAV4ERJ6_9GAST|nr:AT-rich interactive domain-containing protein 2 [Elysia marginata]